jgi:hypothetical protein
METDPGALGRALQWPLLCLAVQAVVALATHLTLLLVGLGDWPEELGVSGAGFCERYRDGLIRQPANTWSTLGHPLALVG